MPLYRVLVGMDYGNTRREPGDIADDIPRVSIGTLLDQGFIEPVGDSAKTLPPEKKKEGVS